MSKNILFVSRPTKGFYRIFNLSCLTHIERLTKKKFTIQYFKNSFPDLKFLVFYFYKIFSLQVFKKENYLNLKYRNCEIGRYATARTFRDLTTYRSKFNETVNLLKYFFLAGSNVDQTYRIADKIQGAYLDHPGYLNGIFFRIFAIKKKIIYSNNYPRSLFFVNFNKKSDLRLNKIENTLRLFLRKNHKIKSSEGKKKILELIKNPKKNPCMSVTRIKKFGHKKYNLQNYDYIVYCHSFMDGALWYGNDGFLNLEEWLEFTLHYLKINNARVIIKPHPNFWNEKIWSYAKNDKTIFNQIVKKFQNENFLVINEPYSNSDFLKRIKKKTILISHHGTPLLEGSVSGFKTICSKSTLWAPKYKISNQWGSKAEYSKLLKKNWKNLRYANKKDLNIITYLLTKTKYAYGESKHYETTLLKHFNMKRIDIQDQKNTHKIFNKINNAPKNSFSKLVNKISHNIEEVTL